MPAPPIQISAANIDFSPRAVFTKTVTGSPTGSTETIIGTLPALPNLSFGQGVFIQCTYGVTIGTSGVTAQTRIRQTDAAGTVIFAGNLTTVTAASLYVFTVQGIDTAPTLPGQVYVVTLTVGSGAATSTVTPLAAFAEVF